MFDIDTREELELAVGAARATMPDGLQRIINAAKFDLYFGPTPATDDLDGDGFSWPGFCAAADMIQDWADDVLDWPIETIHIETNEDGEEVEVIEKCGSIDAKDILREILGKELLSTIYR